MSESPAPDAGLGGRRLLGGGRYALSRRLGGGNQAETFLAVDQQQGSPVVIKAFSLKAAQSWKQVELAQREAQVLRGISHALLPRHVDDFEADGFLYTVMSYVEGRSLAELRRSGAAFGEPEARALLRDASEVFEYLHGRSPPIVHRDVKPSNLLLGPDGRYRLIDFGAVRQRLLAGTASTVVGTFGYMAPEQFRGRASPTSDLYALGATVVAMLTGKEPEDLPHRGLDIDVHAALARTVSRPLQDLLSLLLQSDPQRRPRRLAPLLQRLPRLRGQRRTASSQARAPSNPAPPRRRPEGAPERSRGSRGGTKPLPPRVRAQPEWPGGQRPPPADDVFLHIRQMAEYRHRRAPGIRRVRALGTLLNEVLLPLAIALQALLITILFVFFQISGQRRRAMRARRLGLHVTEVLGAWRDAVDPSPPRRLRSGREASAEPPARRRSRVADSGADAAHQDVSRPPEQAARWRRR